MQAVLQPAAASAPPHKETCLRTPSGGHRLPGERTDQSAEEMKHRLVGSKPERIIHVQTSPTLWRYSSLGGAPFKSRWTSFFPLGHGGAFILPHCSHKQSSTVTALITDVCWCLAINIRSSVSLTGTVETKLKIGCQRRLTIRGENRSGLH